MERVSVETRMRGDLPAAMKARDTVRVTALRTALAAIANAEALPGVAQAWVEPVVGRQHEAPRLELSPDDVAALVREEIDRRRADAADLEAVGQLDAAATLRAEAAALEPYLD